MQLQPLPPATDRALFSAEACAFVAALQRRFDGERRRLLERRAQRQQQLDAGKAFDFLPETASVRGGSWQVAPTPPELQRRWVEITGPVERKMMINAFNSGADCFMADFEDSLSPTWSNVCDGQRNLYDAVRGTIEHTSPDGKVYRLGERRATLLVRPRGWHLVEKHALVEGAPLSASLFDFGFHFFHNARALLERGSGPYFYLPKIESHLEARLWAEVFAFAESTLGVPAGSVRATVLIETLPAAFEMEEILYELRRYASGLNAGRWDYLFSFIKKLRARRDLVLPDRAQLTMTVPFMRAYTELLVKSCHAHGAHAMGGMAPFIPSRKNPAINEAALAKVRADKLREVHDGFDGTWVAHPDLVPVARAVFDEALGERPHQKERRRDEVTVSAAQLLDVHLPEVRVTEAGFRNDISVGLQYLSAWLGGTGAVAIFDLMEDAATAEIARAQLWQWVHNQARLSDAPGDSRPIDAALYRALAAEERAQLGEALGPHGGEAAQLLDELVLSPELAEFLTPLAYRRLD
jgi:malate synthase